MKRIKNVALGVSGLLLLATQVNALQTGEITATSPAAPAAPVVSTAVAKNSSSKASQISVSNSSSVSYSYSSSQDADDPMRAKTFSKSFSVDRSDKVNLNNQYGGMTIKTWDKNEVKVDVDIKAYANTEEAAQRLLDNTNINASKSGDVVSFRTSIGDGNKGSGSRNGKRWRQEVKVYYTVYMPATNALTASQEYGSIVMDSFAGPTSLKVQYGNLTAGDLSNANNYISVQYGKCVLQDLNQARIRHQYGGGLTIASVGTLDLDAQYTSANITTIKNSATIKHQYGSGLTIGTAGTLNLDLQYTSVNIGTVRNASVIRHQYGSGITIGSAGPLDLDVQYATVKIANLHGNLGTKIQYGSLSANNIDAASRNINVNAEYSSVALGFDAGYSADFDVAVSYNSFKYGSNVTARKTNDDDDQTKRYTGQIGKGGSSKVMVRSAYNSVTFR
ncbi:hypothetical protein VRU48_15615 [Pedobacter sp. KR3-3]|uniref:Adhesin domain-containing protein n=1 Tax=Pedobacter albus TaxID=3113905 RepID=A0ABU7IAQ7_9SPHI|nr:hypothetical protein [Pedobacter sp. KR3-3]MEE1946553.1 hypothetical protein [Pedobacter sp. KR3-3]